MSGAEPPVGASSGSSAAILSSPPPQQQEITAAQFSDPIREGRTNGAPSEGDELRGWLMVVATLTASITYSAALNPPGGVWQADDADKGYFAGRPILYDKSRAQYNAFYYCNLTSFVMSLCIVVLISSPSFYDRQTPLFFSNLVTVDIIALAAAFIAGSWTKPYPLLYGAGVLLIVVLLWFVCFGILGPRRPIHEAH